VVPSTGHDSTYIINLPPSLTAPHKENKTYTIYMRKIATYYVHKELKNNADFQKTHQLCDAIS
jgi:hypothetical protein